MGYYGGRYILWIRMIWLEHLYFSIYQSLILQVGNLETSKTVWETITARHVGANRVNEAKL